MQKKAIVMASIALILMLLVAACGAASDMVRETPPELVVVEKAMEQPAAPAYEAEVSTTDAGFEQAEMERMIIWNADISLTVEDVEASIEAAQALARRLGGYTISSDSWLQDEQLYARLTIRVPAERFEEAMAQLRDLALEVTRESANSEDVTDQYVDLESRLRHLEAKEAQLLEFLEDAEDTEAVLAVYEQLDETQAEIEQVKGRMNYLEKLSAMATINVELNPEELEPPVVEEGWQPGRTLRNAARALLNALKALADIAIWVTIFLLPILLLLAVPVILVIWLVRRRRRRKAQSPPPQE